MRIILASASPRRRELMTLMGLDFSVITSEVDEAPPAGAGPAETVMALAVQKASAVARLCPDDCVIGADTIVWLDGQMLGKPYTAERARAYLMRMRGRTHTVFTGVALLLNGRTDVRCCETQVTFAAMTDEEIDWYVDTGEPLDKAGGYGVQGPGGMFVERISGNYFNVIGMPMPLLYRMLKDANVLDCGHHQHE